MFLAITSLGYAQTFDVMTFNLRYDNPGDGVNQWSERKGKVFNLLRKYDPTLIGVQEALHHQLQDIIHDLPAYAYVGVGRDDGKEKGEYAAILYKKDQVEVVEQNTFWLSENPDVPGSKSWDAAITRIATWAIFMDKKTKMKFLAINSHFDHIGQEARKKSAEMLKTKAAALAKNLPVIIMGDFNATRSEAPYAVMKDDKTMPLIDPAPENPPGTFCSFEVNSIVCRGIDYIFYSQGWTAENYQVIQDNDGKYYPSDHLPVMVRLNHAKK